MLINDILDLSKIESGKFEIITKATPIKKLLEETIANVYITSRAKGS